MTKPEKDIIDELEEDLKDVGRGINDFARRVVKGAESAYDSVDKNLNLNDRFIGAAAGGKVGAIVGLKGGPKGAAILGTAGAVAGFAVGDKGVAKYRKWRDGETEEQDVANDSEGEKVDLDKTPDQNSSLKQNITSSHDTLPSPKDGP